MTPGELGKFLKQMDNVEIKLNLGDGTEVDVQLGNLSEAGSMKDLFKDIRETVATSVKDATKAPGNGDGEGEHVPEEECKAKD